tara:strand:+ start:38 stop:433 length:396 start_codon:yes stop_codon:yes gene_type:complete
MNYEVGYVYKLMCKTTGKVYYGSTSDIDRRIQQHKICRSNSSSREIIEQNNYEVLVIETWFNISRYELKREEAKYITQEECINKRVPNQTKREYHKKPTTCVCGCIVRYDQLKKHMKTKKHIKKMEENSEK